MFQKVPKNNRNLKILMLWSYILKGFSLDQERYQAWLEAEKVDELMVVYQKYYEEVLGKKHCTYNFHCSR